MSFLDMGKQPATAGAKGRWYRYGYELADNPLKPKGLLWGELTSLPLAVLLSAFGRGHGSAHGPLNAVWFHPQDTKAPSGMTRVQRTPLDVLTLHGLATAHNPPSPPSAVSCSNWPVLERHFCS